MWSNLLLFGKKMSIFLLRGLTPYLGVIPYMSLIFLNLATYRKLKTIQVRMMIPHLTSPLPLIFQTEELSECLPARAIQQVGGCGRGAQQQRI